MTEEETELKSTCIMLLPDQRLKDARPGVKEIHLTVAYFGHFAEGAPEPARLRNALPNIARHIGGPIEAVANATGLFPDRAPNIAVVDLIDGIGPFYVRKIVEGLFGKASGAYDTLDVKVDYTHGFTPHVTRTYMTADQIKALPEMVLPPEPILFSFDAIGVWHGANHFEVSL